MSTSFEIHVLQGLSILTIPGSEPSANFKVLKSQVL